MAKSVTVRAPCSTANLGPGFDVFGMALDAFYDEVTVTKKPKSFGIKIVSSDDIPLDPKKNTAGIVAIEIRKVERIKDGLEIKIKKNVPAGYGMGSSAASAAACTRAIDELFSLKLDSKELLEYAGAGEKQVQEQFIMIMLQHHFLENLLWSIHYLIFGYCLVLEI